MIVVSIPAQQGVINVCLNASMIKLLAFVAFALMLLTGYVAVQLSTFILNCSPVEFLRIVLFTAFLVGLVALFRFVLNRKQVQV